MPEYNRGYKNDILTYLKMGTGVYYAFYTKDLAGAVGIGENDLKALGHAKAVEGGESGKNIIFLRANAPKPPRVKFVLNSDSGAAGRGSVSTFCAPDNLSKALEAGWRLVAPARRVVLKAGGRTTTAVAELSNGALYAYPMSTEDFKAYAADLGLKSVATVKSDTEGIKLVRGSSYPKPGRAKLNLGAKGSVSTFYSTEKAKDLGAKKWEVISDERLI